MKTISQFLFKKYTAKHVVSLLLLQLPFIQSLAQTVNIPDLNFKSYLISNTSINTNSDTEIQVSEANSFSGILNLIGLGINDLTGIEAFTSLSYLDCAANNLTQLDLTENTTLVSLLCGFNQLNTLNVSSNSALSVLKCENNNLSSLNISSNIALTELRCDNNQLTSLDVSSNDLLVNLNCQSNFITSIDLTNNSSLQFLNCSFNQLETLDVSSNTELNRLLCGANAPLLTLNMQNGNNINLIAFNAINNPLLTCVQVDNPSEMANNWPNAIDGTASYNLLCLTVTTQNIKQLNQSFIYPNPSNGIFMFSDSKNIQSVEIFNLLGELLYTQQNGKSLNLHAYPKGVYMARINGQVMKKLVKE